MRKCSLGWRLFIGGPSFPRIISRSDAAREILWHPFITINTAVMRNKYNHIINTALMIIFKAV